MLQACMSRRWRRPMAGALAGEQLHVVNLFYMKTLGPHLHPHPGIQSAIWPNGLNCGKKATPKKVSLSKQPVPNSCAPSWPVYTFKPGNERPKYFSKNTSSRVTSTFPKCLNSNNQPGTLADYAPAKASNPPSPASSPKQDVNPERPSLS